MAFDLAISEHGDLVFGSNRDLAGISGSDLINQRIKMRLKIMRGSWVYDEDESLGSRLHTVSNLRPDQLTTAVTAYAHEALGAMEEITVQDVQVNLTTTDITLVVFYTMAMDDEPEPEVHELVESVPVEQVSGSSVTTEV